MEYPRRASTAGDNMSLSTETPRPFFLSPQDLRIDDRFILFFENKIVADGATPFWTLESIDPTVVIGGRLLRVEIDSAPEFIAVYLDSSPEESLPSADLISLRSLLFADSPEFFRTAGVANQLDEWLQGHRYCGSCGAKTQPHASERALVCLPCARHFYPRINPCVIVLVVRGEEILLAKSSRHNADFYSCLAGFMEVGEAPEDTVRREVFEEVGVKVSSVEYISSQSWPFPSQLMLGFIAHYESGEIVPEPSEIADAQWFLPDALPTVPSAAISVAGGLIDHYLTRVARVEEQG
jgi:NAD+ diphosphatase